MIVRILRLLCFLFLICLLLFGLWPYNFVPVNQAFWSPGEQGVSFSGGTAYSLEPMILPERGATALSVELLVRPSEAAFGRYSELFSLYQPGKVNRFAISQHGWKVFVLGRYHVPGRPRGIPGMTIQHSLVPNQIQLFTVTTAPSGTFVYLDGQVIDAYPKTVPFAGLLAGQIVLGNSASGRFPWTGNVLGLAIYNRALTSSEAAGHNLLWRNAPAEVPHAEGIVAAYEFHEGSGGVIHDSAGRHHLVLPARLRPLQTVFLEFPSRASFSNLGDVVMNVLGFIPFGFLLAAYFTTGKTRSWRNLAFLPIALGLVTSLTIEMLQVYLPSRDSSWTDVINNTAGTAIGCLLFYLLSRLPPLRAWIQDGWHQPG